MKKITTVLCCIAFAISGVMLAITASDPSPGTGYKTMHAMNQITLPTITDSAIFSLPTDLLLDLAKKKGLTISADMTTANCDSVTIDSLRNRIYELEQKRQVTKVKWKKVSVPYPIVIKQRDTIPIYYLATQTGIKENSEGRCISVYEVKQVNEICPDTINSTVDVDVGD